MAARPRFTVLSSLVLSGLLMAGCGADDEPPAAPAAPAPAPTEATPEAAPSYSAGQFVEVEWSGTWYISRIERVNSDGTFHVHYGGWGTSHDTDVPAARIRSAPADAAARFAAAESPGTPVTSADQVTAGRAVWARWGGRWYEAQVTTVTGGQAHITYPGHDSSWDQDVAATALRLRD